MKEFINQCIELIENKENIELDKKLKKSIENFKENHKLYDFYNSLHDLYDISIKINNIEALTLLLQYDNSYYWFTKDSEFIKAEKKLKLLFKNNIDISTSFINSIIENNKENKNKRIKLLKRIFQYVNFGNNFILHFILNHYKNKVPLSQVELSNIITKEKDKLGKILNENQDNVYHFFYKVPLNIACEEECYSTIKCLIEYGANINIIEMMDNHTTNPLRIVYEKKNEFLIKYLIEHGANVNIKLKNETIIYIPRGRCPYCNSPTCTIDDEFYEEYEYTVLSEACEDENESLVKYLVEHGGADVNLKFRHFIGLKVFPSLCTPLSVAYKTENKSIIKYLIKHGAKLNNEEEKEDNDHNDDDDYISDIYYNEEEEEDNDYDDDNCNSDIYYKDEEEEENDNDDDINNIILI